MKMMSPDKVVIVMGDWNEPTPWPTAKCGLGTQKDMATVDAYLYGTLPFNSKYILSV